MADYKLVYHEPSLVTLKYVEAQIKPETVGHVVPSYDAQTVYPAEGTVFSRVDVDGMPEPTEVLNVTENGSYNVARIGTAEVAVEPDLQSKSVTPAKQTQTVEADSGYDGLERVTVNPIPPEYIIPSGTLEITENGDGIDVTDKAAVNVAVPIPEPPSGTLNIGENGVYNVSDYAEANVNVAASRTPVLLETIDISSFSEAVSRINIDATKYDLTGYMMLYAVAENVTLAAADWLYFGDSYATGRYLDRSQDVWNFLKLLFVSINNQWRGTIGTTARMTWQRGGDTTPLSQFFFTPYRSTNFVSGRIYIYAI